jgi:hypothetical protein
MDKMSTLQIKEFWLKYEQKIVLIVAFCLIAAISFEFGLFQGQKSQQKPLIIEKQVNAQSEGQATPNQPSMALESKSQMTLPTQGVQSGCAFVGSKNSAKFYVPTCTWAKRIKPENLVCYKSEKEAIEKGKTKSECK